MLARFVCLLLLFTYSEPVFSQVEGAADGPSFLAQIFPLVAVFFIMYFLILRPQVKKQKKQAELIGALKKGDEVLTAGGIFGTIEGLNERFVTLEVANNVKIRVLRAQIGSKVQQQQEGQK